jgi:hypothetical protein
MKIEIMLEKEKHFILSRFWWEGICFVHVFFFLFRSFFSFLSFYCFVFGELQGRGVHINHIIKLCVGSFVFLTWSKLLLVDGDALV